MGVATSQAVHIKAAVVPLERATDMCCCFFLSLGLLLSLYKIIPLDQPLPWALCGGAILAPLFITLALNFRRVMLPLAILLAAVLLHNLQHLPGWWAITRAFLHWWQAGRIINNSGFIDTYNLLLHLLPAFVTTIFLWLLLRQRPPFLLLLGGCLVIMAGLHAYGVRNHGPSLYLLAAGLLPLAASSSVTRAPVARGTAAAMAVPITAVILGMVFLLMPADTSVLRWQFFSDRVDELKQEVRDIYRSWQMRNAGLDSFDLQEEYYALLGGPISPDNTRMLVVETTAPQLLKASVYDYYTGRGWIKTNLYQGSALSTIYYPLHDELAASTLPNMQMNQFFPTLHLPTDEHPLTPFVAETESTVTLLHPKESRLFYWGSLTAFSSEDDIVPLIGGYSELISQLPLYSKYKYTFSSLVADRSSPGFTAAMALLTPQLSATELAERWTYSDAILLCLQLPTMLVVSDEYAALRQMLLEIVGAGVETEEPSSLYEQAVLLERWLQQNCRYTLTPETPPWQEDFVLHFMQTRQGYCTYYASAMVVMSRMLGIPARYVTGYNLQPMRGLNKYEATNATAHAWAELYFNGVGWLPFDPTGQADFTEDSIGLSGELTDRELFGPVVANADDLFAAMRHWPSVLITLVLALLIMFILVRQARLSYHLPWLQTRFSSGAIVELYYSRLQVQLNLLGWQRRPAETILAFTRRMGSYLPAQAGQLCQLGIAICALRYGEQEPDAANLHNAEVLYQHFELLVRQKLKSGKYFSYRLRHGCAGFTKTIWHRAAMLLKAQNKQGR